jgi:hypothetical protein
MRAIPTLHKTLCAAIGERRLLAFYSKDHERIAEPHDYGVKDSVRKLFYYQVGGTSSSGRPLGWRWAEPAEISGVKMLEKRFAGPRPAPTGRRVKWDRLFASVSMNERNEEGEDGN